MDTETQNRNFFVKMFLVMVYASIPSLKSYRRIPPLVGKKRDGITFALIASSMVLAGIMRIAVVSPIVPDIPGAPFPPDAVMVCSLVSYILWLCFLAFSAAGSHQIAKWLGDAGEISLQFLIYSALISLGLLTISFTNMVTWMTGSILLAHFRNLILVYLIVLSVIANKMVNELTWIGAVFTSTPTLIVPILHGILNYLIPLINWVF
jgi:hypothetical protein